jgi:predicted ATPase
MNYLRSISFKSTRRRPEDFPFTLPAIVGLETMTFDSRVTFLVGENGSGKSTVLEAIAVGMQCPAIGRADAEFDDLLLPAKRLAAALTFTKSRQPRHRMFFRAEDAMGFTLRLKQSVAELKDMEAGFDRELQGYGRELAKGVVRSQRLALTQRYGEDPDGRSHGEWFLHMFNERIAGSGLYLLDEPETPLSPIHQLSLLSLIKARAAAGCQFIIATHSPILMALAGADILSFDDYPIRKVAWEDVEHVAVTKAFLNNPESYLRHL